MLTLLGSLLGFGSSFLPKIMDYFQDKADKKQELELLTRQAEIQLKLGDQKLEAAKVQGQLAEVVAAHKEQSSALVTGSKWLSNLSGSVRPVLMYAFAAEFLSITAAITYLAISTQGFTLETLRSLLDDRFMGILSTMIAFYYGNRTFGKRRT